ncbi:ABC transporter ATP-binding protein [Natronobacterium texcoconense]|uniref:Nickel import system ATP-binding protein NikD n=1 Tax=Natronobacterium texcoconense TaxID=1095778 RepID=A0A1H0YWS3_NATTX|nr:ABC transporter ATP-binding protein [Natronobacterium texcoconense]SDQ19574.1 peptide/nickel transport system ATP-binding protein [Natronobacterium texcoconense]
MTDSTSGTADREPLLSVENLKTHIRADDHTVHAVDGVSFTVDPGETVCLVGESGSGKSVTCESLTRIVPEPPAKLVGGTVRFDDVPLHDATEDRLREIRGNRIAHVFQQPQEALDPVYTVGDQIVETIQIHEDCATAEARTRAIELLREVGIPQAERRVDDYPHEFSQGMAQRVAIAIALAADPDLLIADEPTTAVDVTVQARLIELLRTLTDGDVAVLLITHDFRVVASLADRVLVMYGGTIVERGPVTDVFDRPAHPYTQALFESYEGVTRRSSRYARADVPTTGCRYRKECPHAVDDCAGGEQPTFYSPPGRDRGRHEISCVHYAPDGEPSEILTDGAVAGTTGGETDD